MVDAYDEIARTEGALRGLVRVVLGDAWLELSGFPQEAIDAMRARQVEDQARRKAARVGGDLLDYTELTQLSRIILRNWEQFRPAIGPHKKNVEMDFDRLRAIRNPVAHTRPLLPYEVHLAAGIGGELRNRIVLYRSAMDEADQIWPMLEYVRDSFGNEVTESNGVVSTKLTLRVGDQVGFTAAATDPEGKSLTWRAYNFSRGAAHEGATAEGEVVSLSWVAREADIGTSTGVWVTVTANERSHHRHSRWDGIAQFFYRVLPAE